jgi:hypothetical protein
MSNRKALARMLPRAFVLGSISGIVAFGPGGPRSGLAAMAGALAAGLYVATYLQSHLGAIEGRTKMFDAGIAKSALLRMVLTAAGAWGSYLAGRLALLAYLLSFAIAFLILLVFEIPNARRALGQRVSQ